MEAILSRTRYLKRIAKFVLSAANKKAFTVIDFTLHLWRPHELMNISLWTISKKITSWKQIRSLRPYTKVVH